MYFYLFQYKIPIRSRLLLVKRPEVSGPSAGADDPFPSAGTLRHDIATVAAAELTTQLLNGVITWTNGLDTVAVTFIHHLELQLDDDFVRLQ